MKELIERIKDLLQKIEKNKKLVDLEAIQNRMKELEFIMNEPDFWSDQEKAKKVSQEFDDLRNELNAWKNIKKETSDLLELSEVGEREGDSSLKKEIEIKLIKLIERFSELEFYILLGEKYDQNNAIVAIHAGAGGVDAQDWAEMLQRMYLRFCDKKGWRVNIVDQSKGGEAGIKSVTLDIQGRYAYGYLKSEAGVHRLVRISPFDAEKMRHTSFALVEVLPELGEVEEVEIKDDDLRIDTFRSSGHGGQSVNTTDSAVRVVHKPTNITVTCRNERSQMQNKENALKILKSKLNQLCLEEQQKEKQKMRGEYTSAEWGNQIRSYVLHPYKMVKDHRTKHEVSDPDKVLDGDLDEFIEAYLRKSSCRV